MLRRTKIIATVGPSSNTEETITALVDAGVDVFRLNFSHGSTEEHKNTAQIIRSVEEKLGREVALLGDLQGPKIRIGEFENGLIVLKEQQSFTLDAGHDYHLGNESQVHIGYPQLPQEVSVGDMLVLDDGRITMVVENIDGSLVKCRVQNAGILSNHKGVNRHGGGLSAAALTSKDIEDIKVAANIGVDYLAVSFPKSAADMYMAQQLMRTSGGDALLIAKIERAEAIELLEEILSASDGIMVARGDLAVEVGDAAVPALQKTMVRMARLNHKISIVATQMMDSMVESPIPTRAEVSDVANAVLDGTDAVMLSAETASGKHPIATVISMAKVCVEAEHFSSPSFEKQVTDCKFTRLDQSIAMAALFAANHLNVKAIATLTQSGFTAMWISRINSGIPIFALSPEKSARRKMKLFRHVHPLPIPNITNDTNRCIREVENTLLGEGVVSYGDTIIMTFGEPLGITGGTNTMKLLHITK
ncbi:MULTISPECIES: pyruvate kinase [Candidatus Ichthyocystis]|uniref:Pyruvate kinase n=1 Tax=Candidatus Ichthyocystis hellenicum TaxID=1561003 RepID=A0A0S4M5X9_9BURK|nr:MULTISPECIES: pyruvate kinase [Ichthyocystis]CUT18138.1 pyruvate kinase [Candidatus Ichthyocystis hellenicum]